jgi:hypothetical protein
MVGMASNSETTSVVQMSQGLEIMPPVGLKFICRLFKV